MNDFSNDDDYDEINLNFRILQAALEKGANVTTTFDIVSSYEFAATFPAGATIESLNADQGFLDAQRTALANALNVSASVVSGIVICDSSVAACAPESPHKVKTTTTTAAPTTANTTSGSNATAITTTTGAPAAAAGGNATTTAAPSTTAAPVTTAAPAVATTTSAATTAAPVTTAAPATTAAPVTTAAPATMIRLLQAGGTTAAPAALSAVQIGYRLSFLTETAAEIVAVAINDDIAFSQALRTALVAAIASYDATMTVSAVTPKAGGVQVTKLENGVEQVPAAPLAVTPEPVEEVTTTETSTTTAVIITKKEEVIKEESGAYGFSVMMITVGFLLVCAVAVAGWVAAGVFFAQKNTGEPERIAPSDGNTYRAKQAQQPAGEDAERHEV